MINIIAAVAKNGVIGSKGSIPWVIPEDKSFFRETTEGGIIIMGRRTFEEIGFPLSGRFNIVVSESRSFCGEMLCTAVSLENAIELAEKYMKEKNTESQIFLCGGEKIYTQGLKYVRRMYLTELDDEYEGDTFFPKFSDHEFRLVMHRRMDKMRMTFCIYERCDDKYYK